MQVGDHMLLVPFQSSLSAVERASGRGSDSQQRRLVSERWQQSEEPHRLGHRQW